VEEQGKVYQSMRREKREVKGNTVRHYILSRVVCVTIDGVCVGQ
jgi:hypothetical protein